MGHTEGILLAKPFGKSYALLSEAKVEDRTTAVVFVHGLLGDAVSTWWRFQTLIDEHENTKDFWSRCDLYFYQYNSFGHEVSQLSEDFRGFLKLVFPRPSVKNFESRSCQKSEKSWHQAPLFKNRRFHQAINRCC